MKNNPRPIIEWLNELPELIRELVIADCIMPDEIASCLSEAILGSCYWHKTKIGFEFYSKLKADALYHEQNNIKIPR